MVVCYNGKENAEVERSEEMKIHQRIIFFLFVFTIGLGACYPAAPAADGRSPEEAAGDFETQVAAKVETQRAEAEKLDQVAALTVEAALALTAAAGGETPIPTETQAAVIPTDTLAPTLTLTPEPSITIPAGDPAVVLGLPDFEDAFDNATNWSPYDSAGSRAEITGGKFVFTKKVVQFGSHWTLSWPTIEDYYLQATVQTPAVCSGYDRYGFIFRAPDPSEGVLFMVSCNGQFKIAKWNGSETTVIVDWTASGAIAAGPNQSNRIGVLVEGETIKVYAHGTELVTVMDSEYVGEYRFGLLVGAGDTEPFTVRFDDLAYWILP